MKFLRANHQIDMRQIFQQRLAPRLSHTAEETEKHVRALFRQSAEHSHFAKRFLVGHVAHTARVQQHDISFRFVRNAIVTACDERMGYLLRVALVHLAAVRLNEKFRH
jgi:endonuclease/exonuclease/phosphatase family metal-dependent hydrolase